MLDLITSFMGTNIYLLQNKWDRSVPLAWLGSSATDDLSSTSMGHRGGHSALVRFVWQSCNMHSSRLWLHSSKAGLFSSLCPKVCFSSREHQILRGAALEEMHRTGRGRHGGLSLLAPSGYF